MMGRYLRSHRVGIGAALAVLVIAYVFYAINPTTTTSVVDFAWSFAVPLVLAAMVGVIGERSGVINIGIEGQMLAAAFVAFFAAAASGSLLVGALAGIGTGLIAGAFLAWTTVTMRMDQIIAGVVLNIVATGLTSFYYVEGKTLPGAMPNIDLPLLGRIPLIGPVFFEGGPFSLLTLLVVLVIWYALFFTRWGLRTRAIGEYPAAAASAGVKVNRMRFINVTIAGGLAGAAGAYLSMEASSSFSIGMTAGRGFLALAIMIFGAWHPVKAAAAALFFGLMSGLASQLQADGVLSVPQQLTNLLPYVLTLVVLAVFAGRVRGPAAAGEPFIEGEA